MSVARDRFVKLMMMTTSSNDAEALTALRKANAILKSVYGKTWAELFAHTRLGIAREEPQPEQPKKRQPWSETNWAQPKRTYHEDEQDADTTQEMLDKLLHSVSTTSGFYPTIESWQRYFDRTGRLTPSQHAALKRAFERQ